MTQQHSSEGMSKSRFEQEESEYEDFNRKMASKNERNEEDGGESCKVIDSGDKLTRPSPVYLLRCELCNFESIVRHRFDSHEPCASKMECYRLYTCSQCSACSTSRHIMDEHGEVYHKGEMFDIQETAGRYNPSTPTDSLSPPRLQPAISPPSRKAIEQKPPHSDEPTKNNKRTTELSSDHCATPPVTMQSVDWSEKSSMHTGGPISPPNLQIPSSTVSSFYDLITLFTQQHKNLRENMPLREASTSIESSQSSSVSLPHATPVKSCPFCDHPLGGGMYELVRHLAMVHLIPCPDVANYLPSVSCGTIFNGDSGHKRNHKSDPLAVRSSSFLSTLKADSTDSDTGQTASSGTGEQGGSRRSSAMHTGASTPSSVLPTDISFHQNPSLHMSSVDISQPKVSEAVHGDPPDLSKACSFRCPTQLFCPHCGETCSSVQHLQLHLLQTHSDDLNGIFNLSQAMLTGRMPGIVPPFSPQLLSQHAPTKPHSIGGPGGILSMTTSTHGLLPPSSVELSDQPKSFFRPSISLSGSQSAWSTGGVGHFQSCLPTNTTPPHPQSAAPSFSNMPLATALATAAALGIPLSKLHGNSPNQFSSDVKNSPQTIQEFGQIEVTERKRARLQEQQNSCLSTSKQNKSPLIISEPGYSSDQNDSSSAPNYYWAESVSSCLAPNNDKHQKEQALPESTGNDTSASPTLRSNLPLPNFNHPLFPGVDSFNLLPSLFASMQPTESLHVIPSLLDSVQRSTKSSAGFTSGGRLSDSPLHKGSITTATTTDTDNTSFRDKSMLTSSALMRPSISQLLLKPKVVPPLSFMSTGWPIGISGFTDKTDDYNGRSSDEQVLVETGSRIPSSQPVEPSRSATSITTTASMTTANMELTYRNSLVPPADSGSTASMQSTAGMSDPRNTETAEGQTSTGNGVVHNTLRKTRSDMKVIHRYLVQVKHDTREIHLIPYYELDQYVQDFVLTAKKKDGHEYEPESLKAFVHSLERHLKQHGYPHSVLKGSGFAGTRTVLNQRLNELRALSRAGGPTGPGPGGVPLGGCYGDTSGICTGGKRLGTQERGPSTKRFVTGTGTLEPTPSPIHGGLTSRSFTPSWLMQNGLLGKDNPQAILNSLWLINRTQFNMVGTQRHRNLVWGQFQLVLDEMKNKAIEFKPLFEPVDARYCRGYGGTVLGGLKANEALHRQSLPLSCTGSAKRQPLPFNCVELFELYANLRPQEARGFSEPFYLSPDTNWKQTGCWFKTNAASSQLLSRIPRSLGLKPSREPVHQNIDSSGKDVNSTADTLPFTKTISRDPIASGKCENVRFTQNVVNPYHFDSFHDKDLGERNQQIPMTDIQSLNIPLSPPCPSIAPANLFDFFPFIYPSLCDAAQRPSPFFPLGGLLNPNFSGPDFRTELILKGLTEKECKLPYSVTNNDYSDVKFSRATHCSHKVSDHNSSPSPDHSTLLPSLPAVLNYALSDSPEHSDKLSFPATSPNDVIRDKKTLTLQNLSSTETGPQMDDTAGQGRLATKDDYIYSTQRATPGVSSAGNLRNSSPSSSDSPPSTHLVSSTTMSELCDDKVNISFTNAHSNTCTVTSSASKFNLEVCKTTRVGNLGSFPKGPFKNNGSHITEGDKASSSDFLLEGMNKSTWVDEALNLTGCKQDENGIAV